MRDHHSSALIVPADASPKFLGTEPSQVGVVVSQMTLRIRSSTSAGSNKRTFWGATRGCPWRYEVHVRKIEGKKHHSEELTQLTRALTKSILSIRPTFWGIQCKDLQANFRGPEFLWDRALFNLSKHSSSWLSLPGRTWDTRSVRIADICVISLAVIVPGGIAPKSHSNTREGNIDVVDPEVKPRRYRVWCWTKPSNMQCMGSMTSCREGSQYDKRQSSK
jgi:hypothetical protein